MIKQALYVSRMTFTVSNQRIRSNQRRTVIIALTTVFSILLYLQKMGRLAHLLCYSLLFAELRLILIDSIHDCNYKV